MVVAPAWAQRAVKTRQLSLETAMDRGDAVFTFHTGTATHTFNILTTTNIQILNDQDLEHVAGGFRLWRFIKGIFGFGKKAKKQPNYNGDYWGNNAITK